MTIRILVVDDHPIVRQGLKTLLEGHSGWQVVGEASDGAEAVEKAKDLTPDVMVFTETDLDVMMQVKRVFNPDGLLNPAKIFPSRRGCTEVGRHTTTSTAEIGKRVDEILRGTR